MDSTKSDVTVPVPVDSHQFIFLCHENFPNAIWSHQDCDYIGKQLMALVKGKGDIALHCYTYTVIVGCVMVTYTQPPLDLNTTFILPLRRTLNRPIKLLNQHQFPDFYMLHLNIPHQYTKKNNTIIANLCEQNPHLNCHLWTLLYQKAEGVSDHFIFGITKQCFRDFKYENNIVQYNSYQLMAPLEFYEAFNTRTRDHQAILNQIYCKFINHLLAFGCTFAEAQQLAVTAIANFKQIIIDKSPSYLTVNQILDDFNPDRIAAAQNNNLTFNDTDLYVIISKRGFPKSYLRDYHSIVRALNFFISCLPIEHVVGDIACHIGWLKLYYRHENAFKILETLIQIVADPREPLQLVSNNEMSGLHFISFTLPICGYNDQKLINYFIRENITIDFSSWVFVERRLLGILEEFQVTMATKSYNSLKINMFKFRFKSFSYRVNVLTGFVKRFELSDTWAEMQVEYLKYLNYLLDAGVNADEAENRAVNTFHTYQVMILPKNKNSSYLLNRPIFFNVLFTQNVFESLQLLDEIMIQPKMYNKYVLLCNNQFPKYFLSNYFLNFLKKGLCYFLNQLPVVPEIGSIIFDAGWLKIYYGNDAALKVLVKIIQIINDDKTSLKLILDDEIPQFKCVIWPSFPDVGGQKQKILENLKCENSWIDLNSWWITKRETNTLYITMDPSLFSVLQNNYFYLKYKSKKYITQPQDYAFISKDKSDILNQSGTRVLLNFEPIKLKTDNRIDLNEGQNPNPEENTSIMSSYLSKTCPTQPENSGNLEAMISLNCKPIGVKVTTKISNTKKMPQISESRKKIKLDEEKGTVGSSRDHDKITTRKCGHDMNRAKYADREKHGRNKEVVSSRKSREKSHGSRVSGVSTSDKVLKEYFKFVDDLKDLRDLMTRKSLPEPSQLQLSK